MRLLSIALGVLVAFDVGGAPRADETAPNPVQMTDGGALPATPTSTPPLANESVIDRITPFITSIDVHGFVTQAALKTTGNNFLVPDSKTGSLDFSEAGINFTKVLTDRLRVGFQLYASDIGTVGGYTARFDWFYLDYRFNDWLGIRAGRTKVPYGLYNEIIDIDSAYVPALLPQSVYPEADREFLLAQTGMELYGRVPLRRAGALEYRAYGGTYSLRLTNEPNSQVGVQDVTVPYVFGGRLMWELPVPGLRIGASIQSLRIDANEYFTPFAIASFAATGQLPAGFDGLAPFQIPAVLWLASAEYLRGDLLVSAEYGQWRARLVSPLPSILPHEDAVSDRFYVMASYHVLPWLTPDLYYAGLRNDGANPFTQADYQQDFAATVRFDLNSFWILKLEAHQMVGTAELNPALNDDVPLTELPKSWWLFMVKTTAYF